MIPTNQRAVPFSSLPDSARLWIFAAAAPVSPDAANELLERVDTFLEQWNAHGHPVVGARDWRHGRFLLVAADEEATGVSGCSTDTLFRVVKEAERDLGVSLLDSSRVWFRDGDGIRSETRAEFRDRVKSGAAGGDTLVFDNTAATVGEVRAGRWERPMREAWHGRVFKP